MATNREWRGSARRNAAEPRRCRGFIWDVKYSSLRRTEGQRTRADVLTCDDGCGQQRGRRDFVPIGPVAAPSDPATLL